MSEGNLRGRRRFWLAHAVLPLAATTALLAWLERSGADLRWSDAFFRPTEGGWYLRKSWWTEDLLHRGGRGVVVALAVAAAVVAWRPGARRRDGLLRKRARYVLAVMAAATASIALIKASSPQPCPWDVDRYGGRLQRLALFEEPAEGLPPGRCFPSAHAGTGYSLLALYFALRDRSRRAALAALVATAALGTAFGVAQVARGAHFASHVVASALWCWLVALVLYEWLLDPARSGNSTPARADGPPPSAAASPPDAARRYSRSAP